MTRKFILLLLVLALPVVSFAQISTTVRKAPDFPNDAIWLDQGHKVPHSIKGYRGKVVLVDFWEYTCINCIRDFAIVKRWYQKYHPYGFEVIGVHFGEFKFGHKAANVARAAKRFRLPWPVVSDTHGAIWNAYGSDAWPNRYLIDQQGNIVMQVKGEQDNEQMEAKIRELLARQNPEVAKIPLDKDENTFAPQCGYPTQETYVGNRYGRGAVENAQNAHNGDTRDFKAGAPQTDGGVWLDGRWKIMQDGVTSEKSNDTAALRYHARSTYAVISVSNPKKPIRIDLEQDDAPLKKADAGVDVRFDQKGAYIEASEPRMYYLVKNTGSGLPLPQHLLTLEPEAEGFTLHSFTFGNNCQQNFAQR